MCYVRKESKVLPRTYFANHDFVPGKARVVILWGGCFQELAHNPEAVGADVVIYGDVADEIVVARPPGAVKTIVLAQHESLITLVESVDATEELKKFVRNRPGALLSQGLGQIRVLGYLAAQKVLRDPNFKEWIDREVFEPLMLRHNGMLKEIEITVFSSSGGGTGSGGSRCFGEALKQFLLTRTPALVHLSNVRIGCLAFTGLGPRTRSNAAGALPEDIAFAIAPDRASREIRSLILSEMPMDGEDKDRRDMHASLFVRSLRTQSVRSTRDRVGINVALSSRLGAITIARPSFYEGIPDRIIAAETCAKILPPVAKLLATPADTNAVAEVRVILKAQEDGVLSAEELMGMVRRSPKVMPEDFADLCDKTVGYNVQTHVVLHGDMTLGVSSDFERMMRQPCQTPEDYERLLGICGGVLKRNEDAATAEARKLAGLQASLTQAKRACRDALDRAYPRSWWQGLSKAVSHPATNEHRLHSAILRLRERADEVRQFEARVQARAAVRELVQAEHERICAPLRRLGALLEGHRPVPGARRTPWVTVAEDSFARILPHLDSCRSERDTLAVLVGCVQAVTSAGLAQIVGAASDDPRSLARALAANDPPTLSPWWGGAEPTGARRTIFVLPPIPTALEDDLRELLQAESGGQLQVAVAGTAAGGLNVVRMEYVKPERVSCLETPLLATTYEQEVKSAEHLFRTSVDGEVSRMRQADAAEVEVAA